MIPTSSEGGDGRAGSTAASHTRVPASRALIAAPKRFPEDLATKAHLCTAAKRNFDDVPTIRSSRSAAFAEKHPVRTQPPAGCVALKEQNESVRSSQKLSLFN